MTTLRDIAQQAGVNITTASKVLNGGGGNTRVGEETQARIIQAARDLRYRPNSKAQSVRNGRANAVALVLSTHAGTNTLPTGVLGNAMRALAARHMHLILTQLGDEALTSEAYMPRVLRDLMADGLLIDYTHAVPEKLESLLEHYRIPAVWLNRKRKTDSVYPDDLQAGRLATEHLLALGHRRIVMLSLQRGEDEPLSAWHYSEQDRFEGYAAAMRLAGLEPVRVFRPAGVPEGGMTNVVRQILSKPDRPTAFVAYMHGDTVVHAAVSMGLRVPEQLSVVSFLAAATSDIGLAPTCALLPVGKVATVAVEMLMAKIADPDTPQPSVAVPVTLATGASTAVCPC